MFLMSNKLIALRRPTWGIGHSKQATSLERGGQNVKKIQIITLRGA